MQGAALPISDVAKVLPGGFAETTKAIGPAAMAGLLLQQTLLFRRFLMTYDFAPLFRSTIGFDRLARIVDSAAQAASTTTASVTSYPPYNIEKTGDDSYVLTMAVAGFGPEYIELTAQENILLVSGRVAPEPKGELLHRGIAGRAFERKFALADHIVVESAELVHGLLHVSLRRCVPESLRSRRIAIGDGPAPVFGQSAANDKQIQDTHAA